MADLFHQQCKKAAGVHVKSSKVALMLVPNGSKSVPRDIYTLKKLDEKNVEIIFHIKSALEAKKAIVKAFNSLQLSSFIFLKVDNAQRFNKDVAHDR